MAHLARVAALVAPLLGICLMLVGCGGGGGPSPAPSSPAFDLVKTGMRSVSYAPMYLKDQSCIDVYDSKKCTGFPTDDFAAPWAQPIFGAADGGRGDLANLASMGANAVRLYGNDPRFDKKAFLDEASSHGMQVIDGMSDYWFKEGGGPQCAKGTADCHDTIREAFTKNLDGGFLNGDAYHSALAIINVYNEPDFLGDQGHFNYLTAVVTAFDGILSAEKARGVQPWKDGTLPRMTITWSFAEQALGQDVCSEKYFIKDTETECGPGLIFMVQFYRVVMDPVGTIGYTPKNDLKAAYLSRWINGVNLFVAASQMDSLLMAPYRAVGMFEDIRIFCGEWHPPEDVADVKKDLQQLAKVPGNSSFIGLSYFQYQVAYNKDGSERSFGLFQLGSKVIGQTGYITGDDVKSHPINCLVPGNYVTAVTQAWNGTGAKSGMCTSDKHASSELVV